LEQKLLAVLNMDETILQKATESNRLFAEAGKLAEKISDNRHKQIIPLEDNVNRLLSRVGMPNAKLKVEVQPVELNSSGADAVEFLFDANLPATTDSRRLKPTVSDDATAGKGGQFQPVRKVASGGELSRLMLCIKSLVAQSIQLPTLIFDEIDSGISGEAARQVGIILKDLAEERQVICITHQPQIAGKANAHFFVYKKIINNTVQTNIRLLTTEERIIAIAKMLSGEKPTAAAIENAREMVMN
jgi:DNA repair protein RecN (Recombination protein N)